MAHPESLQRPDSQHPANSGSSSEPSRHWMMPSHTMDWKRHCWRFLHTKSMKRVHRGSERDQRGEGAVSPWSWGPPTAGHALTGRAFRRRGVMDTTTNHKL